MKSLHSLLIVAAAAVLLGGVAVATLHGESDFEDLTKGAFPNRIPHTISLPDSSKGVDQRVTEMTADLLMPAYATIDFKNGDTGQDLFRADGTTMEREVFYKQEPGQPKQLKWRASIAEDGVTYLNDAAFWQDGTKKRVGDRLPNGTYLIFTYFLGGTLENSKTILAADGSALFHRVLRENGQLEYLGQKTKDGIEEKAFAQDGKPTMYNLHGMFRSRKIEYYGDSGVPKTDFLIESYQVTALYYAANGKLTQKRVFKYGGMDVFVYENGVPKYQQYWQRMNPEEAKKGAESIWQLYSVARIDTMEKEHWKLWFHTGAKVTTTVPHFSYESLDGKPTESSESVKVSNYTEAGCLKVETWQDAQFGNVTKRIEYPQDRGCSTTALPVDLMKEIPFVAPPITVPEPEPHHP